MTEAEMLQGFVKQLAICEFYSLHTILPQELQTQCLEVSNYMRVDYFDSNYKLFVEWWDKTIVPLVEQLQAAYERNESI